MKEDYINILSVFNKLYVNIIDNLYMENYEVDKFAFPFYQIENCDITFVVNDTDYFTKSAVYFITSIKLDEIHVKKEILVSEIFNKNELQGFSSGFDFKKNYRKIKAW